MSTSHLRRLGLSKADIRQALKCCLRRVARGRYVVTMVCAHRSHRLLWESIESGDCEEFSEVGDMRDKVELLKIVIRARAEHLAIRELAERTPVGGEMFSHVSAALIHELPLSRFIEHRAEVSRPTVSRTYPNLRVRRREVAPSQIARVGIFRVTVLERTLIDMARDHPLDIAVPMFDHALRQGSTTAERIADELEQCTEVLGTAQVKTALTIADGRRESVAESICGVRFFESGICGFEPQVALFDDDGRFLGRVDFCHRAAKVVVEVDGLGKYYLGSGVPRVEIEKEKQRESRIRAAGYRVVRLSWKQLFRPEPFQMILELTASRLRAA